VSQIGEELPLLVREAENPVIDPYRFMSLPATLRHEDDRLVEAMRWHLRPFSIAQRQPESYELEIVEMREDRPGYPWRLTYLRGGLQLFRGTPASVLDYALWDIHSLVHGHCMDFLFLHAGVVSAGEHRLILPAAPDAGKSTLVASLLREGCSYLSDELAPIDPVTSGVYPFPKHIAIAKSGLDHVAGGAPDLPADYPELTAELSSRYLRPADLSAVVAGAGPVDMIVFLTPDREGRPQLHPLSSAETLAQLLDHSLNAELYGDRAVTMLARVIKGARSFELTGGSSAERASLLRAQL
jgi:hypothetical protein